MKAKTLLTAIIGATLGLGLVYGGTAFAQHGGYGMGNMSGGGMGMMSRGGMGMMSRGGMGMGAMGILDLSDAQRTKIRRIQNDLRKKNWATKGKIMDERTRVQDLYAKDTPSSKAIGAVYGRIFALKRQMIEAGVTAKNQQIAVLTPKQRQKMKAFHRNKLTGGKDKRK